MKKIILLCTVAVIALGFTGCNKNTHVQTAYTFGITQFSSTNLQDLQTIEDYLTRMGCLFGTQTYEGEDINETDNEARRAFERGSLKINKSFLDALELAPGMKFTYSASRLSDPTNPDSKVVVIGSYDYTAPDKK